jgi:osmoprotectant transport system substrate-binding protein
MLKKLYSAAWAVLFMMSSIAFADAITLGAKGFTEQLIIGEITRQYLSGLGYDVDYKAGMTSIILRQAQVSKQVDLYWEYTGTSLITYNKIKDKLSPADAYTKVKQLDKASGLIWLKPTAVNDTYGFAMVPDIAAQYKIKTLSDLANFMKTHPDTTLAISAEFAGRPDGLQAMENAYDVKFDRSKINRMDPGLVYVVLRDKRVDVAGVNGTDGRLSAFNLQVLLDDKSCFPTYQMTPVVREDTLAKYPRLESQLNAIVPHLTQQEVTEMNKQVDVEKIPVAQVAATFLRKTGLMK